MSLSDSQKKLFIVEDDLVLQDSYKQLLERVFKAKNLGNFKIVQAEDGVMANWKIDKQQFDLYIVDIQIPKLSGITVVENLYKKEPSYMSKILIVSGELSPEVLAFLKKCNLKNVLLKPFDPKKFVESVAKILK